MNRVQCIGVYAIFLSLILPLGAFPTGGVSTDILYVDDDGGAAYTRIQDALDAAQPGDTIFVYDGVYRENLVITTNLLTLQGESEGGTIIDGRESSDVIFVSYTSSVDIHTFTIRNAGIYKGIHLYHTTSGSVTHCTIYDTYVGIMFDCSDFNTVSQCTFRDNHVYGAETYGCSPRNNTLHHNNFLNNNMAHAYDKFVNYWDNGHEGNYWDDYRGRDTNGDHIGDTPYNISGGNNEDAYPLMDPSDTAPPRTTHTVSGTLGNAGWYTSTVDITLQATDPGIGVNHTHYKLDNGAWNTYTAPLSVSTDGVHTLSYYSRDKNGNDEDVHTHTFKVDTTGPVVTITTPQARLYLFDREIIPTATPLIIGEITLRADIVDAHSGVHQATFFIDDESVKTFDTEPYEWLWDDRVFGRFTIKVTATDTASATHVSEAEVTVRKLF